MDVISLQSRVRTGYVGNAIAAPMLARAGVNVHIVDTVTYEHHPGHGPVTPEITPTADVAKGLSRALDACARKAVLLSGYLANAAQGCVAAEFASRARTAGKLDAWYLDPVFGDDPEGIYVKPEIVAFYRDEALPACDVLLPNRFELSVLTEMAIGDAESAAKAARAAMAQGPGLVFVSSVPAGGENLSNVLVTPDDVSVFTVPRRRLRAKGTGDMLSAAFSGYCAAGATPYAAAQSAVEAVQAAVLDASSRDAVELDPFK